MTAALAPRLDPDAHEVTRAAHGFVAAACCGAPLEFDRDWIGRTIERCSTCRGPWRATPRIDVAPAIVPQNRIDAVAAALVTQEAVLAALPRTLAERIPFAELAAELCITNEAGKNRLYTVLEHLVTKQLATRVPVGTSGRRFAYYAGVPETAPIALRIPGGETSALVAALPTDRDAAVPAKVIAEILEWPRNLATARLEHLTRRRTWGVQRRRGAVDGKSRWLYWRAA